MRDAAKELDTRGPRIRDRIKEIRKKIIERGWEGPKKQQQQGQA
jgi:hypothetical protein